MCCCGCCGVAATDLATATVNDTSTAVADIGANAAPHGQAATPRSGQTALDMVLGVLVATGLRILIPMRRRVS